MEAGAVNPETLEVAHGVRHHAHHLCPDCNGWGETVRGTICRFVNQEIFRRCLEYWQRCAVSSLVDLRRLEWRADFELLARRHLNHTHHRLFRWHYLLGADARLCAGRLGMSSVEFSLAAARVGDILGHLCANERPYAVYPIGSYRHHKMSPATINPSR